MHAFGDWFAGGEVVAELIPFPDRQYRVDFALPRWRVYVEVLLTPPDILVQTKQLVSGMHTGMYLVARKR